jgi:hypothetical protein
MKKLALATAAVLALLSIVGRALSQRPAVAVFHSCE